MTGSAFTLEVPMSESLLDGHLHRGCGGRYVRHTEPVTIRVSGMTATVDRVFYRCSRCDDEHRTVEQREAAERAAVDAVRVEHALLAPRQIRQLRESLGLTTEQMGDLLYGIPRTIVEGWEKGRYVQNREVNEMMRRLEDPEFLRERAARAGVTLPEPAVDAEGAEPAASAGNEDDTDMQQAHAEQASHPDESQPTAHEGEAQDASADEPAEQDASAGAL